jgi:hypothetical protein
VRIPMPIQRSKLLRFFEHRPSATRGEIEAETGIPAATLTTLLRGDEFEQIKHGVWRLKR